MITFPSPTNSLSRRGFLQLGTLGVGGLSLPELYRRRALGATDPDSSHKSVIVVLKNGCASQLDMFDMKPEAPAEFRGTFHRGGWQVDHGESTC